MGVKTGCTPGATCWKGNRTTQSSPPVLGGNEGPTVYRESALFSYPTDVLCGLCQGVFGPLANATESRALLPVIDGLRGWQDSCVDVVVASRQEHRRSEGRRACKCRLPTG
jgi:hypothetical protein